MTYAFGWALQQAIRDALAAHPDLAALVGGRIWDEAPHRGATQGPGGPYVLIGDEAVAPWNTATDIGAMHEIEIAAVGAEPGYAALKRVAAGVCDAMLGPFALSRGRVVSARFLGAKTRRTRSGLRRIDMRFRVAIENEA